jgi:hypothetical protein
MTCFQQHYCVFEGLNHKFCYEKFSRFVFTMIKYVISTITTLQHLKTEIIVTKTLL